MKNTSRPVWTASVITFNVPSGCNTIHYILLVNNIIFKQHKLFTLIFLRLKLVYLSDHGTGHMTPVALKTQEIESKDKFKSCYLLSYNIKYIILTTVNLLEADNSRICLLRIRHVARIFCTSQSEGGIRYSCLRHNKAPKRRLLQLEHKIA